MAFTAAAQTPHASGEEPPPWAYPIDPPGLVNPKDDGTLRHVPESTVALTLAQVRNGFEAPDWHPGDHPAMPEIVVHGRKPAVMACGYCHRAEGTGGPENASLAGQPAPYILQQMADFKSGARSTSLPLRGPQKNMLALAKAATTEEAESAAAYFSSLKPKAVMQVIESDTAPKTHVHGWHLAKLEGNETEPLGQRIVEFPDDLEQFISRDTHTHFTAYVPRGSIARGKELATTGGNGRTVACAACHGADLKGLGSNLPANVSPTSIPSIAGRSPTYLVRQMYDFQHGVRAGAGSALMKPTVEKLTLDDMIDLAAYASSLAP